MIYLLINDEPPRSETFDARYEYQYYDILYQIWENTRHRRLRLKEDSKGLSDQLFEDPNLTIYNSNLDLNDIPSLLERYKQEPESYILAFALSKAYRRIEEKKLEEKYLKKALQLSPFSCEIIIALGNFYANNNQYAEAVGEYSKCLDDPINSSLASYNIGMIYLNQKKIDKAKEFFSKVRESNSLYGEARKQLYIIENLYEKENWQLSNYLFVVLVISILIIGGFVFLRGKQSRERKTYSMIPDIDAVKEYLIGGELEDAFLKLNSMIKSDKFSKSMENDLVIYQNRWKRICHSENLDVISNAEINTEKNKIIKSLLSFLDDLEKK